MGTKQALAPIVADVARLRSDGPFLDAFAGMCSVANHLKSERNIWTNDLQNFAVIAAQTMLCDDPNNVFDPCELTPHFTTHFNDLCTRFRECLRRERSLLVTDRYSEFATGFRQLDASIDRRSFRKFDLFSTCYANTYIGLEQAIELDSILFAIDQVIQKPVKFSAERRRALFALGRTLLRVSTTTGHFAQYQTPSERNWQRFQRTRRASVLDYFARDYVATSKAAGARTDANRAFNMDALSLLRVLRHAPTRPSVVYADPPYKQDQYSRYYHLLETLVLYDYPRTTGKAKYRTQRANSIFSSKLQSNRGVEALSALTSDIGADLILSYPEDGIADIRRDEMITLLSKSFRKVELVHEGELRHSTMGASKGAAKQAVIERIYLGQN